MTDAGATAGSIESAPRSRLLPGTRRGEAGEVVRGAARSPEHSRTWSWAVLGGTIAAGVVGVLLIALAGRLADRGDGGAAALTWIGLGVAVLPAVAVALTRDASVAARWTALATVAVASVVPVGLRSGAGPATVEDLIRYAQLSALRRGGPLLADQLPAAALHQPGSAALTAAVERIAGLTPWHSALVVVVVAHVAAVVGLRALVRALGLGERVAVLAAILWALGPAVLVATSRVGGTTLGLALLLWAVTAVVQAATAAAPGRRLAWTVTAVALAAATAVTDLAAAWTLVGLTLLLGLVTVGVSAPPVAGAQVRRAWWPAAAGVLVVTGLWSLTPAGRRVLSTLGAGRDRAWNVDGAEITLGVAAVLLGLGLAGFGMVRWRARQGETGPRLGAVVAILFPVSLLGLLGAPTSTLAVVLWPVLAAGLAPFVAGGALALRDLGARRVPLPVATGVTLTLLAVVLLGASAATTPSAGDPVGRPVAAGSMAATEVVTLSDRLADLAGPRPRFLASDPALAATLTAVGDAVEVTTVAPDDVFGAAPTARTAAALRAADVGWLVDTTPGGDADLALTPWLVRVLTTPSVTVYRVRPAVPGATDGSGGGDADTPATTDVVPAADS